MSAAGISAIEAWTRLSAGNQRFVAATKARMQKYSSQREDTQGHQRPISAILSCSDSRVPIEILFDQGIGDLFVVRNAGQISSPCAFGSLEFAVSELEVPLLVVLSHSGCGAIKAAIAQTGQDSRTLSDNLNRIVQSIIPAVTAVKNQEAFESGSISELEAVADEHLRRTVNSLMTSSKPISSAIEAERLEIVGAKYSLTDGRVLPITKSVDFD